MRTGFLDHPLLSARVWLRGAVFWAGALAVSAVAIGLAHAASSAEALFGQAVALNRFIPFALTPAGFAAATWLTRRYFPGAQGSGIPQVIAATTLRDPVNVALLLSPRVAAGKLALTLLGLLCGASIGREGPTVQIGAAVMQGLGRLAGVPSARQMRALVLAGGAAGVAAAFNTPLAGVVFTIEELSRSFDARTSGAVMTAVIVAGIATVAITGGGSYFGQTGAMLPVGSAWVAVLACAVLGGLSGGLFARLLIGLAELPGWAGRFVAARPVLFAAACGVVLAGLGVASHGVTYGTGYAQAGAMVAGHYELPLDFFVMKFAATLVSYASGVPGGIFAPSLAVGAGLGRAVAFLLPHAPAGAVVLLGMVAYFSGVVQAPLTAAVIVMEMTDNQDMKIPLMAASFLAFGVSRLVCKRALYGVLARRLVGALEARAPVVSGVMMDETE